MSSFCVNISENLGEKTYMSELDVGTNVTCGICGRETKVQFITDREGGKAFDLDCMHRNAICPTCNALVRDDSDQVQKIEPLYTTSKPEAFVEEEEDEDEVAAAV